jgi:hypothetical protein
VGVGLVEGEDFVGALHRAFSDDAFVGLFHRRRKLGYNHVDAL